jgi:hypothetical protein
MAVEFDAKYKITNTELNSVKRAFRAHQKYIYFELKKIIIIAIYSRDI